MNCVASSLPGRIRLRHPALRNPDRLARLQRTIAQWSHVQAIMANAKVGSLLMHYDVTAVPHEDFVRQCELAFKEVLPTPARTAPPPSASRSHLRSSGGQSRGGTPRVRANRMAKRAMLASLAATMLLAALGAKRWHLWTAIAFLHALGVHLWVHRRNLLR